MVGALAASVKVLGREVFSLFALNDQALAR
jgi:hypothetical protein